MPITMFDHYTVRAADLDVSWRFYEQGLGLRVTDRPNMATRAALVYLGDQPIVHLFQEGEGLTANMGPTPTGTDTGRLVHIAFNASGLPAMRASLQAIAAPFRERTLERAGKHQILLDDPDGVELEINFALSELATAG